jgi:hypothetical protein
VRPQELDDSEFIEIELFDLDEFLDLVRWWEFLGIDAAYKALDYLWYTKIV